MIGHEAAAAVARIPEVSAGLRQPASVAFARSESDPARASLLFFSAGATEPAFLAKVGWSARRRETLRVEHHHLCSVWEEGGGVVAAPRPVGLVELRSATINVQSCSPGVPLSVLLRRRCSARTVRRHVDAVVEWLRTLHRQANLGPQIAGEAFLLDDRLAQVLPQRASSTLRRVTGRVEGAGARLPEVRRHGDLWPGNLLWHQSEVTALDWESSRCGALPTDDLFFFLTTYGQLQRPAFGGARSLADGFSHAWLSDGWYARLCVEIVHRMLAEWFVAPAAAPAMFVRFLLDMIDQPMTGTSTDWSRLLAMYADSPGTTLLCTRT